MAKLTQHDFMTRCAIALRAHMILHQYHCIRQAHKWIYPSKVRNITGLLILVELQAFLFLNHMHCELGSLGFHP